VVHRDLKPSNILVGSHGEVQVIDWGLAAPPDPAGGRARGGTPAYMAPEQVRGGPTDGRTDVYGLGAVLYELLAGRAPFPRPDRPTHPAERRSAEVMRQVEEGPAPPAKVPRGLAAVCLKAMSLDPARRYATASELAGDVGRWLDDRPVTARRDPALVRARRWAWRNPAPAGAGLALLLALAVGVPLVRAARAEAETAEVKRREADASRHRAERFARGNARRLTSTARLARTSGAFDPAELRRLLEASLADYEAFGAEANSEELRLARGRDLLTAADLYVEDLGQLARAGDAAELAEELFTGLSAEFPGRAEYESGLALALNQKATVSGLSGDIDAALASRAQARRGLERLCADPASATALRPALARVYEGSGRDESILGHYRDAEVWFEKALALHEALAHDEPDNPDHRLAVAKLDDLLSWCLDWQYDWAGARHRSDRAAAEFERLMATPLAGRAAKDRVQAAFNRFGLQMTLMEARRASRPDLERTLAGAETLIDSMLRLNPTSREWQGNRLRLASMRSQLAGVAPGDVAAEAVRGLAAARAESDPDNFFWRKDRAFATERAASARSQAAGGDSEKLRQAWCEADEARTEAATLARKAPRWVEVARLHERCCRTAGAIAGALSRDDAGTLSAEASGSWTTSGARTRSPTPRGSTGG
jgi:hypothetical protein